MIALLLNKFRKNWLLVVIFILAVFLRFHNTPARYFIDSDQSRDALIVLGGSRERQLPLIGSFSSLGPFTFGPWYYWQLILFNTIFPVNFSPWIYLGLASLAFILVMYKLAENLIDRDFALITIFLIAISDWSISSATDLSNPILVAPFAALSLLLFVKFVKEKPAGPRPFLWGLVMGIAINLHYQAVGLLSLPLILFVFRWRQPKFYLYFALGCAAAFIPLLIFDLNNHWFNLRNIFDYYLIAQYRIYVPNRWLFYLRDFWPDFWGKVLGTNAAFGGVAILTFILTTAWAFVKKKTTPAFLLLLAAFTIDFIMLRFYRGERSAGYLFFLLPYLYLFNAFVIWSLTKILKPRALALILLGIIALNLAPKDLKLLFPKANTAIKDDARGLMRVYPGKSFSIYYCQEIFRVPAQMLSLNLSYAGRESPSGVKIGYIFANCPYPVEEIRPYTPEQLAKLKVDFPTIGIPDLKAVDLSRASPSALVKTGWISVTPQAMYNSLARWWYDEKP